MRHAVFACAFLLDAAETAIADLPQTLKLDAVNTQTFFDTACYTQNLLEALDLTYKIAAYLHGPKKQGEAEQPLPKEGAQIHPFLGVRYDRK